MSSPVTFSQACWDGYGLTPPETRIQLDKTSNFIFRDLKRFVASRGHSRPPGRKQISNQLCSRVLKFLTLPPTGRNLPKSEAVGKALWGLENRETSTSYSQQTFYSGRFNFTKQEFGISSKQDMQQIQVKFLFVFKSFLPLLFLLFL